MLISMFEFELTAGSNKRPKRASLSSMILPVDEVGRLPVLGRCLTGAGRDVLDRRNRLGHSH